MSGHSAPPPLPPRRCRNKSLAWSNLERPRRHRTWGSVRCPVLVGTENKSTRRPLILVLGVYINWYRCSLVLGLEQKKRRLQIKWQQLYLGFSKETVFGLRCFFFRGVNSVPRLHCFAHAGATRHATGFGPKATTAARLLLLPQPRRALLKVRLQRICYDTLLLIRQCNSRKAPKALLRLHAQLVPLPVKITGIPKQSISQVFVVVT